MDYSTMNPYIMAKQAWSYHEYPGITCTGGELSTWEVSYEPRGTANAAASRLIIDFTNHLTVVHKQFCLFLVPITFDVVNFSWAADAWVQYMGTIHGYNMHMDTIPYEEECLHFAQVYDSMESMETVCWDCHPVLWKDIVCVFRTTSIYVQRPFPIVHGYFC